MGPKLFITYCKQYRLLEKNKCQYTVIIKEAEVSQMSKVQLKLPKPLNCSAFATNCTSKRELSGQKETVLLLVQHKQW